MNNIERITQDIFDLLSKPFATIRGISTATKKNTYRVVNIVNLKQIKHSVLFTVFIFIFYLIMHKRSLETMVLSLPVMLQWEKGLDLIFATGILEAPIAIHTEWET